MKLASSFQGFIVVFLIVTATSKPLDRVDLMVIVTRSFTFEFITVVVAPIPSFSVVSIVVASRIAAVKPAAVVVSIVSSRRLVVQDLL